MNPIVKYLQQSPIVLFIRIWLQLARKAKIDAKYISASNRDKDWHKMQSDLAIRVHAIEKGMSIGSVKVGFGKPKVLDIIKSLQHYLLIGGSKEFAEECYSVLIKYVDFNKSFGAEMQTVENKLVDFAMNNHLTDQNQGGIYLKAKEDVISKVDKSFVEFSQMRFSVRDFGKNKVHREQIEAALKICERTPSACNRQPWSIYVYETPELKNKMFSNQGGCNGFYEDMQYAILICGDQRNYNLYELYQAYVDGGLYGMNLMYALYSQGLATIPLTMGLKLGDTFKIKKAMGIPDYDIPVLLIGVGSYKDEYKVAASVRKDYHQYTQFL
ncbi:nitroreductase family protein [Bacteroides graminisolvens]|uniref:nitroreductase family protein n=1 Tax=Bacteroides graminisolvens TaxID=477666 RepID=UPI0023F4C939|nr:nitroreductase family protein [Bacteroides graminisolvens]